MGGGGGPEYHKWRGAYQKADVMGKTKLADYLFTRIHEAGVEYSFGIPGDFVLPVYAAQERAGVKTVVMTHEPSVGYAADAYARLKGLDRKSTRLNSSH